MSTIHVSSSESVLAADLAEHLVQRIDEVLKIQDFCALALSGGTTPQVLFKTLAAPAFAARVPWEKVHVFWADERFVPLNDADSNAGQFLKIWKDRVPLPSTNLHAMPVPPAGGEARPDGRPAVNDMGAAAIAYEETLRRFASGRSHPLDIALLGIGGDGHTASLFPHHRLLNETARWVMPIEDSPKPPPQRLTLTLPVLNQTREALFLAAGNSKAKIIERILKHPEDQLPAQMIKPVAGHVFFWLDAAAAALVH